MVVTSLLDEARIVIANVNHLVLGAAGHGTLIPISRVKLAAVDPLTVEEGDELASFSATASLHFRVQALDCDWLEFAEGRLEFALLCRSSHDSGSKHLRLLLSLALLLFETIAWVSGLRRLDLLLVLATLRQMLKLLLHALDLVERLVRLGQVGAIGVNLWHEVTLKPRILELSISLLNILLRVLTGLHARVKIQAFIPVCHLRSTGVIQRDWSESLVLVDLF